MERHHLFPRAWLEEMVTTEQTEINQMANYALLEWPENIDIGKTAPSVYVPAIKDRFAGQDGLWSKMVTDHALPPDWEQMDYQSFLEARRKLMPGLSDKASTPSPEREFPEIEGTEHLAARAH